jgi:hypothetical protein
MLFQQAYEVNIYLNVTQNYVAKGALHILKTK